MTAPPESPASAPDCWQCRHFGLTYEPRWPYLCRLMGFKSPQLPCRDVLQADGRHCRGFEAKPPKPPRGPS
ncbi:MAG: hypothetical protein FJY28_08465 [Betaproteobacteria bacterium]|nr:hypothetical protein [Betaproteobacteria bacterium]